MNDLFEAKGKENNNMKARMAKTLKALAVAGVAMCLTQGAWAADAKAVYRTNDGGKKTLTFYYDNNEYSGDGVTQWKFKDYPSIEKVDGFRTGNVAATYNSDGTLKSFEIPWVGTRAYINHKYYYGIASYVQKVVFDDSFKNYKPKSVSYWFSSFYDCTEFAGWENLDLSECLNMQHLFYYCTSFEGPLDFSATELNCVTNLRYTFSFCKKLKGITGLKVPNPTLLVATAAFREDNLIEELDLTRFNTRNCMELDFMFYNDYKLKKIYASPDFGWWDEWMTNNVEGKVYGPGYSADGQQYKTRYMFTNCVELVGGNGTKYENDFEYIGLPPGKLSPQCCATNRFLIDGWDGRPGYLTARAPSYGDSDGRDWLFNHAIAGKAYAGEAAESSVDLFYVYPTLAGGEVLVMDGFRGIDDATMRRNEVPSWQTAAGAFNGNARCFADLTHVYAPYYRQATVDTAMNCATNEQGQIKSTANADYLTALYQGPAYADVTNALETYFTKWNKGRKFMLAGHSQGSAILRLVMENYFMQDDTHRAYLKQLVASYQIGFGVSKKEMDRITAATGVTFATCATDTCVVVSYNLFGPGAKGNSVLLPDDAIAINPISWSRDTAPANKSLNLGALTNEAPEKIVYGLYGATVNADRGTVECAEVPASSYVGAVVFGEKSLHGQDYSAFWEDLHKNAYDRIAAATGKFPVVGQPKDYANRENWMAFGDMNKTGRADKPFDIFYAYPTSTDSMDYVADVNDYMLEQVTDCYRQNLGGLESYANVYVPYHRQLSVVGLKAAPTADGQQLSLARHVVKTDLFAALDHYFANANAGGARPFVLVGHSQGAADLKNILEQYFIGEKKSLLKKMIACYAVGWTFSSDWCAKYGYTFATGANDTNVLIAFEAEGPDITLGTNMLTSDPKGLAINPLNWKRDDTYAPITENLGSYKNGACIPGGADGRLDAARPGALIVTNTVFDYSIEAIFGKETYHQDEFAMFRGNICDNILARGKTLTGYARLLVPELPEHVRVTGANAGGEDLPAVGGSYWAVASAASVAIVVSPTNENPAVAFANGEREMSLPVKYEDGAWVTAMSEAEITAATKTGTATVQLGIVAQRYPWNGMLDIQYRTPFANATWIVTFSANGTELGQARGTGGLNATASFDLNAIEAFREKTLKSVKITATVE